jgi:hypothetical protein
MNTSMMYVPPSNAHSCKSSFLGEVHFDIKDHMTIKKMIANRHIVVPFQELEILASHSSFLPK